MISVLFLLKMLDNLCMLLKERCIATYLRRCEHSNHLGGKAVREICTSLVEDVGYSMCGTLKIYEKNVYGNICTGL